MRTHLPLKPDDLHTWDDIRLIDDDMRNRYAKTVAFAKSYMAMHVSDDESASDWADLCPMSLTLWHQVARNHPSVVLTRHEAETTTMRVSRQNYDIITAFYFPSDLQWVELVLGDVFMGKWTRHSRTISDILEEARTGPARAPHQLEELLTRARIGGNIGHVHQPLSTILIDGVEYTRLEMMQPFLPMIKTGYGFSGVTMSEPCTFFVEECTNITMGAIGLLYKDTIDCFYVNGQRLGIATILDGTWSLHADREQDTI